MNPPRILVAGVGNIFLGDDAFGVEVAQRLAHRRLPDCVRLIDFGIRGLDLTYALLDDYDVVILVDAAPRGCAPGTLYVLEPQIADDEASAVQSIIDLHSLNPAAVLRVAWALGGKVERVLLVGCEPGPISEDEARMEMSAAVAAVLDEAAGLVISLVAELCQVAPASILAGERSVVL